MSFNKYHEKGVWVRKMSKMRSTFLISLLFSGRLFNILIVIFSTISFAASPAWHTANGPEGGLVFSLAECKGILFAGTYGGGIMKSIDTGNNWAPSNYGIGSLIVHDIVSKSDTLFAGTWGYGIYRSVDMGKTWVNVFIDTVNMDSDIKGMGAINNMIFASTKYSQFLCSKDNGKTWVDLITSPTFPKEWFWPVTFIGMGSYIFVGSTDNGIICSADNGKTWARVNTGLADSGVYCLTVKDTVLFAGTYKNGIYISYNAGNSWNKITQGLPSGENKVNALSADGNTVVAGIMNWAGIGSGVYSSRDCGKSWQYDSNGVDAISIHALNNTFFVGSSGAGIYRFNPNQHKWEFVNSGLNCRLITNLAVSDNSIFATDYYCEAFSLNKSTKTWNNIFYIQNVVNVITKVNENIFIGTSQGVVKSIDGGNNWTNLNTGLRQQGDNIISFAKNDTYLFAGGGYGVYRMPLKDSIWEDITRGLQSGYNLIISDGPRLFVAGIGVFLSRDGQVSWLKKINETPFKAINANGPL